MTSKPATQDHWEQVYGSKDSRETSWFEPSPKTSLLMIDRTGLTAGSRAIDVGGGASSLVDHLLQRGFEVAVLDIADEALAVFCYSWLVLKSHLPARFTMRLRHR